MPLMKLLQALCGAKSMPAQETGEAPRAESSSPINEAHHAEKSDAASQDKKSSSVFGLVARGPHGSVSKLAKKSAIDWSNRHEAGEFRLLEMGVDDGTRAIAVLTSLASKLSPERVCYVAIDEFEMGAGPATLKDFNCQVRQTGIRPMLFPMPTYEGLKRVAHTLGQVHLVVDAGDFRNQPDAAKLISKVMGQRSTLLGRVDGHWKQISFEELVHAEVEDRQAA